MKHPISQKNYIVLLGNGFDLAHGINSSYNSFIKNTIESQFSTENNLPTIIRSNKSIKSYHDLTKLINRFSRGFNSGGIKPQEIITNKFFEKLFTSYLDANWCDIEDFYFQELLNHNSYSSIKELNKQFKDIIIHLEKYLTIEENNNVEGIITFKNFFNKLLSRSVMFINFNYTNTITRYFDITSESTRLIHIHGRLNDTDNPIIFGFAANKSESRELVNKGDKEYMRHVKKHCYKRTDNEDKIKKYLNSKKEIIVYVIGHSCGISDKLILNEILNHKNVSRIFLFYYNNYEHFFELQVNADRIMNNDDNFRKIQPFINSIRIPQYNDDEDTYTKFNKKIPWVL